MPVYGFDVHRHQTTYAVMTTAGTTLARGQVPNAPEAFAELVATHGRGPVALEATANWYYLYECLEGLGVPVHLAHPKQTRLIAASKRKTDQLDAERLAHLLRTDLLPTSYVPPPAVRELRETLRSRARLVRQRTQVKNHLRAVLAKQGLRAPYTDLGGPAARTWLTAQSMRPVYAAERDAQLALLQVLDAQITTLTRPLQARARRDPDARWLQTIPGIGALGALLILAEVGAIARFPGPRQLAAYAGLVPTVRASGDRVHLGRITKDGSRWLRWILVEATYHARHHPAYQARFERLRRRRGKHKAAGALARHLSHVGWFVLTKQEAFNPTPVR